MTTDGLVRRAHAARLAAGALLFAAYALPLFRPPAGAPLRADAGLLERLYPGVPALWTGLRLASLAASLALLGALALKQAEDAEALPLLERAVAIYDAQAHTSDAALQARFNLARALIATRGDRSRALAEAQTAAAGFRAAGPSSAEDLAEVEAFIAAAPP